MKLALSSVFIAIALVQITTAAPLVDKRAERELEARDVKGYVLADDYSFVEVIEKRAENLQDIHPARDRKGYEIVDEYSFVEVVEKRAENLEDINPARDRKGYVDKRSPNPDAEGATPLVSEPPHARTTCGNRFSPRGLVSGPNAIIENGSSQFYRFGWKQRRRSCVGLVAVAVGPSQLADERESSVDDLFRPRVDVRCVRLFYWECRLDLRNSDITATLCMKKTITRKKVATFVLVASLSTKDSKRSTEEGVIKVVFFFHERLGLTGEMKDMLSHTVMGGYKTAPGYFVGNPTPSFPHPKNQQARRSYEPTGSYLSVDTEEQEEILEDEEDTWLDEKLVSKPAEDPAFDIEVDVNLHVPIVKESPSNDPGSTQGDTTEEDDAELEGMDTDWDSLCITKSPKPRSTQIWKVQFLSVDTWQPKV
ncbi:uncharacterized protein EDB91DRAFT_1083730 [Suillus paluster]|uniref:uncharacterized protein n=1 Tax=Suillus paluster TaxID=48578 RepID=UPI001B862AED|nr:uncharacterized protein EDB91DRAFT_1083730 [Suillus paluster]KAG1735273.1 hypothetical protein EDB91DRAFT_1083730 [Suillus paluster]